MLRGYSASFNHVGIRETHAQKHACGDLASRNGVPVAVAVLPSTKTGGGTIVAWGTTTHSNQPGAIVASTSTR